MTLERIKQIGKRINGPILENTGTRADAHAIAMHNIVKHKLSIPTEDDNVFNATNMEKGGHKDRLADVTAASSDAADVNPVNLPSTTVANDKTASAKVAQLFHSLATRRGIAKMKTESDASLEQVGKLMSINARARQVEALRDTAKRFEDNS